LEYGGNETTRRFFPANNTTMHATNCPRLRNKNDGNLYDVKTLLLTTVMRKEDSQ
jgi:hypothetical protein